MFAHPRTAHVSTALMQESLGAQPTDSVDQLAPFWPSYWSNLPEMIPHGGLDRLLDDHVEQLEGPFGTVYDLDYCLFKQLIGTIYWG